MKAYLLIFAIILATTTAKAQTAFRTNESISSQLKNGTVPGLVYGKTASSKKETTASANAESSAKHIRNNSLPGVASEKKTAETKPQTDLSAQNKRSVQLASDRPVEIPRPVEKVERPKGVQ
ncbi:hypothetical protein [Dyadobacter fermentans]|uniref:Uncharacterized protein n=1 Tax=Dyadobacter fermentans (strain ATCC 700827 / DSM 18053 / CIP 107007 / KCTC 52180 / NS114) TaxID=471854 RepID=C6VVD0_DYAFD|nr:hypothetical protein [Dyadobacter fermentans]ACT96660.1 hypothetical protein Dfer_5469 [Dyadobacter fermentans DSM 18053]